MSGEVIRWTRVKQLFQAALDRPPDERSRFLAEACSDDSLLREEVESLLSNLDRAADFAERSPVDAGGSIATDAGTSDSDAHHPALEPGVHIGPYVVLELIGRGGMGDVYRALDTTLHRHVAVKVVSERLASDPQRSARFEREARLLAALNHPNIAAVYSLDRTPSGRHALVLELVDGPTLADRLREGPLPLDQALHVGRQILLALEAAHRQGIVHRDLKPANIKLRPDGAVKVLDFGLAKSLVHGDRPTLGVRTMASGVVMGTPAYMSPEQACGLPVDGRADIWAFGCVSYEILTGTRAFEGASVASTLANVIGREPRWERLPSAVPPSLATCLRDCLRKDAADRVQTVGEVLRVLEQPLQESPVGDSAESRRRWWWATGRGRRWAVVIASVLLAAAALRLWYGFQRPVDAGHRIARHTRATFAGNVLSAAIAPDGNVVAFASGEQGRNVKVSLRDLTSGQVKEIWQGAFVRSLKWLPNGSALLTVSDGGVLLIDRSGGTPRQVAWGAYAAPSPDGSHVAHSYQNNVGFSVTSLDGTQAWNVQLKGFRWLTGLDWSPVTNRILLLTSDEPGASAVWSVSPEGTDLRQLYSSSQAAFEMCASPAVDAVYLARSTSTRPLEAFWRSVPLFSEAEIAKLQISRQKRQEPDVLASGLPGSGACSVSSNGQRLLYLRRSSYSNLWRLDLRSATPTVTAVTNGTSLFSSPHVTPDGRFAVATEWATRRIVKVPLEGGEPIHLVDGTGGMPSPDGDRLLFLRDNKTLIGDAEGSGSRVMNEDSGGLHTVWLPDGRLAWKTPDQRNYRIRNLVTGREEMLVRTADVGWVFDPQFSPLADQVAVNWNRYDGGMPGLWLLAWPGRDARFLAAGLAPIGWSADGNWVYAFDRQRESRDIVRVSVRSRDVELLASFPRGVVGSCSVAPDHTSIVCALTEGQSDAWIVDDFDPDISPAAR